MEITWLGHSCFKLKGKQATLITDPCPPELGYAIGKQTANVITLSHHHPGHAFSQGIGGNARVVSGPGEYEISNMLIIGVASFHDNDKGSIRGKNTIYLTEIDEVSICHLGKLGHLLNDETIEAIGNVDILLVPVGGNITIDAAQAARLVRTVEPKIVIPMHFKTASMDSEFEPVEKFLTEIGSQGLASSFSAKVNQVCADTRPVRAMSFSLGHV